MDIQMRIMNKRHVSWGLTLAGVVAAGGLMASPAFADPPPGAAVSGSVAVSSTLALSFSTTSFSISTSPGVTSSSNTLTATVTSNDGAGYGLTSQLASTGFSGSAGSIPVADFTTIKYMQPGPSNNFGYVALPGSADAALTIASNTGPSAAAGDVYPDLAWRVVTPGNQPSGTYTATDNFVLLGN